MRLKKLFLVDWLFLRSRTLRFCEALIETSTICSKVTGSGDSWLNVSAKPRADFESS